MCASQGCRSFARWRFHDCERRCGPRWALNLTHPWKPITNVQFCIRGRKTRPQMLQVAKRNEIVVLLVFDVRLADDRGALPLCVPPSAVEGIVETCRQEGSTPSSLTGRLTPQTNAAAGIVIEGVAGFRNLEALRRSH